MSPDTGGLDEFAEAGAGVVNAARLRVRDPYKALAFHNLFKRAPRPGQDRTARAEPFGEFRITADCGWVEALAIVGAKDPVICLAEASRLFKKRVEDRGEVAGRGIDNLQDLRGRGLLLQRLARLGQEPRVLHCDDGLRREIFEQGDLLVGERLDRLPIASYQAEERPVLTPSVTPQRLWAFSKIASNTPKLPVFSQIAVVPQTTADGSITPRIFAVSDDGQRLWSKYVTQRFWTEIALPAEENCW
jgi:hypothetical protein